MCIGNRHGQSNTSSAHGFGSIMVRDESGVIEIGMNLRVDSCLDKALSGFSVPDPPMGAFVG